MPRPKKNERELKSEVIGVRFTREERQFMHGEADICCVSLSSLIRSRSLGKRVTSKADLRVLAELRRLDGLLKHLHNETKCAYSALTSDCLREIAAYVRNLNAELNSRHGDSTSK
jgi:hypothetical protein